MNEEATTEVVEAAPPIHPSRRVAGAMTGVPTDRGRLVWAVQWEDHDPLTCDGNDLQIDTSGFLDCPASECRWSFDPTRACPDHRKRGN